MCGGEGAEAVRRRHAIDANQPRIIHVLEAAGVRVWDTSALGSGFPDLVCYRPATGLLRLVEVKDGSKPPSARKLTAPEQDFARNFPVWVVNNEREALAAMGITVDDDGVRHPYEE